MQGNTPEVRLITSMAKRVVLACALALGGCESAGSSELQVVAPDGCSDSDPAVVYRLTELHVPTPVEAAAGATVGHDLDGVDDACDVHDYAGGVDNTLVDLAHAVAQLTPDDPIVMQDLMDQALFCTNADPGCTPQWLGVRVQECRRGAKVDVFRVTESACEVLGTAATAGVGPGGELHAEFGTLLLDRAFEDAGGVDPFFQLVNVRLTATITANGLSNAVLGGVIPLAVFEAAIPGFLPSTPELEFPGPLLRLSDIGLEPGGECDGVSVGLTLSAAVEVEGESCE